MTRRIFIALFALLCFVAAGSVAASAVRDLDDANFEHLTQASTGQTTGTWLVAFAPGGATGALRAALNAVSAASSRAVITASVDTTAAKATAARFFGDEGEKKSAIIFKDRVMYEYPGSLAPREGQADELLAFATDPSASEGKAVPRPASSLDAALSAAREALAPVRAKLEELFSEKIAPAVEPFARTLEEAGISGSTAVAGGLGATVVAAVVVALAGKKATAAAAASGGRGGGKSSGKRSVATRQSTRRSTSKRA